MSKRKNNTQARFGGRLFPGVTFAKGEDDDQDSSRHD